MLLLRGLGALDLLALFAVFMPAWLMASIHEGAGLGRLPSGPAFEYLARSASLLYALQGALAWFLSYDVRRYRKLIRFLAMAGIVQGFFILGVDLHAGMPALWTLTEVVVYFVPAVAVLWMLDRCSHQQTAQAR